MAEHRYWDAGPFIALLKEEEGRVEDCRSVIRQAESGDVVIFTSAFTITEVLWPKGKPETRAALAGNRELVRQMFRHSYVRLIQVDRRVAEQAQDLVWGKPAVKPKDAIHVASSLLAKIEFFETYDERLLKLDGKIGDPPLKTREPVGEEQLPLGIDDTKEAGAAAADEIRSDAMPPGGISNSESSEEL